MFNLLTKLLEKISELYPQNKRVVSILDFFIEKFIKISELYPKNKEIMFALGRLYLLKGDNDKSIMWLEKTSTLYPQYRDAMFFLANLYILKNDYENCIICFFRILDHYHNKNKMLQPLLQSFEKFEHQIAEKFKDRIILQEFEKLKPQISHDLQHYFFANMIYQLAPISVEYEKIGRFRDAQTILYFLNSLQKTTTQSDSPELFSEKIIQLENKIQHQEAELMRSRQMAALGVMASGLAHEINQPLQIILARAQNCISDIRCNAIDTDGIINDFEHIANTVRRIDKIVNHLHVLSRDRKIELKQINVNDVIHNSFIMFQQQLKNRQIAVEFNLADNLLLTKADMIQLEQVFINLINNSRDALEEISDDKKITITTRTVNDRIEIRFHDNGKGVVPEDFSNIFNAFYTTKPKGVGLGLYISQDIIEKYGGTIMAESNTNEGTTFVIRLPIAAKEIDV